MRVTVTLHCRAEDFGCRDTCLDPNCFVLQCLAPVTPDNRARFRLSIRPDCLRGRSLDFLALTIGETCYP